VLLALGCDAALARSALRLSLGRELVAADIDRAVAEIAAAVRQARAEQPASPAADVEPGAGRLYRAA
jgi:cysteine sulfinate desulfinase/cysteine desulfurase-like protein